MRSSPLGALICKLIKTRAISYHKLIERYAWKGFKTKYWLLNPLQQLRVRNLFNQIIGLVLCSYISCYCLDTIYCGKPFGKAKLCWQLGNEMPGDNNMVLIAGGVTIIAIRMAENWSYRAMLEGARWVTTIVGGEVGLRLGWPLGCGCGTVGGLGGSMLGWRVCSSLSGSAKRSNSLLIGRS